MTEASTDDAVVHRAARVWQRVLGKCRDSYERLDDCFLRSGTSLFFKLDTPSRNQLEPCEKRGPFLSNAGCIGGALLDGPCFAV